MLDSMFRNIIPIYFKLKSSCHFVFRGECNGKNGIFPASFVRIVDSFPGDAPPIGADLRSYIKAQSGMFNGGSVLAGSSSRTHNDYMNTQNAFPNLTESLKVLEPSFTGTIMIKIISEKYKCVH